MLTINDLHASIQGKEVLKGISLTIRSGEIHAIMGPNGYGKSTLAKILAGHPDYEISRGKIEYDINFQPRDLLALAPDERAREGVFLAFQYPVEVPGVSNFTFLRASFNAICKHQGAQEMDEKAFRQYVDKKAEL